jgi:uncharacterized protein DUF6919
MAPHREAPLANGCESGRSFGDDHVTTDEYGRNVDHAHFWQEATTLAELGEVTARWLEGSIEYCPYYMGPGPTAEAEGAGLLPVLVRFNRHGFVTIDSQPGIPVSARGAQRAFVSGFCSEEMARRIERSIWATDLIALPSQPGAPVCELQIPVTLDGLAPMTWLGLVMDRAIIELSYREPEFSPAIRSAIAEAWQLAVFDPRWGRNDLLWTTLEPAIMGP